jgi:hypothetical protein
VSSLSSVIGVALVLSFVGACSWQRQTVPLARQAMAIRVPHQQRLVAMAVEQAVENLDFAQLAGKSWRTEVNGVFPHSREDLLDYVQTAVERRLGQSGATVIPHRPGEVSDTKENRLVISVTWGGIDTSQEHFADKDNIFLYTGVGVGALLSGIVIAAVGGGGYTMIPASLLMAGGAGWLGVFPFVKDLTYDTYTLTGRVRLAVSILPAEGGQSTVLYAEGETQTIIDPASKTGFMLAGPESIAHTTSEEKRVILREDDR